jgi:hypothetical protein
MPAQLNAMLSNDAAARHKPATVIIGFFIRRSSVFFRQRNTGRSICNFWRIELFECFTLQLTTGQRYRPRNQMQ